MFGSHPVVSRWTLDVVADVAATWAVFSDTDRFNRAAGMDMRFEVGQDADGKPLTTGSMRRLGMTHTWDEPPWSFEAPHWYKSVRIFHGGPAARVEVTLRLEATPTGTRVDYTVEAYPRSAAMRPLLVTDATLTTRPQLDRALRAAARVAEGADQAYDPQAPPLGQAGEAHLAAGLAQVHSPQVAETIGAIVRHAPLPRQDRIHPTAIARSLGLPEGEVITGFLEATRAGVLELRWDLLCPSCRAPKGQLAQLSAAPAMMHCASCDIRYDGTFPDAVVVSFRPAPQVRAFDVPIECMLSPQRTPHVLLQRTVRARDVVDAEVTLEPGAYLLEIGDARVPLLVHDGAARDVATIIADDGGCAPAQVEARPGRVRLIVRSRLHSTVQITLRHRRKVRRRLTLGRLLALPGVMDLLPDGTVAAGVEAKVGWGAVLAVDEVLGRGGRLGAVASMLGELEPTNMRQDGGSLVATWADAGAALAAAQWLVGDLRVAVGLDHGPVVIVSQGTFEVPCGLAVDGALDAARAMGAGRVGVGAAIAEHPQAHTHLGPTATLIEGGESALWMLRDTAARDRYVEALRASSTAALPTELGGRYTMLRELGSGGQGAVYLVRDRDGTERVAKVLLADVMARPRLVQFFVDEARIAAAIDHPAIPKVLDAGVAPGERLWMVMERVHGETAAARVERAGALPVREVGEIALTVLDALSTIHRAGLVHRDIKPENIMVGPDGGVHLLDLGIARLALDDDDPTLEGNILGTPLYLAPEQLVPPYRIDGRADLYALGLVMYNLLTATMPFSGRSRIAVAMARLKDAPAPLSGLRPDLAPQVVTVVEEALARDPDQRYADAGTMAAALAQAVRGPTGGTAPAR